MKNLPATAALLALFATDAAAQCTDEVVHEFLDGGQSYANPPRLETPFGAAVVGGPFAFQVIRDLPNGFGAIFYGVGLGTVFVPSLEAFIHPLAPFFFDFFVTDDDGRSPLIFNTPIIDPSFCGDEVYFQAWVIDPTAPDGFALSDGVRVRVGTVSEPLFAGLAEPLGDDPSGPFERPLASLLVDLDGDGQLDLVTTTVNLLVRLGKPDGSFGPVVHEESLVGFGRDLDTADVNGDGHADVLVATDFVNSVTLLLGDGAGAFLGSSAVGVHADGRDVAGGDVNEDGLIDVAVATTGGAASIHLNLGGGFLTSGTTIGLGGGQSALELVDLDQDAHLDLVAARSGGAVAVRTGRGNGTFDPTQSFATGAQPEDLVVADLDGDLVLDVATVNLTGNSLSLLRGLGDGSLVPLSTLDLISEGSSIVAGDFDGDGDTDLAATVRDLDRVAVFEGLGGGSFVESSEWSVGSFPRSLHATDLDGDGAVDLLAVSSGDPDSSNKRGSLTYLRGTGDGSFLGSSVFSSDLLPSFLALGDFDGDGRADTVTTQVSPPRATVRLGRADGSFGAEQPIPFASTPRWPVAGDLNGDHVDDLVVAVGIADELRVLLSNGNGTFTPAAPVAGFFPDRPILGDLNNDGALDLVFSNLLSNDLRAALGQGDGTFAPPIFVDSMVFDADLYDLADFDGDGNLDLVVRWTGATYLYRGDGLGGFAPAELAHSGFIEFRVADLDQNGIPDLALSQGAAMLGNGDGTFQPPLPVPPTSVESQAFAIGDVDGDGIPDHVLSDTVHDSLIVLRGRGDGTFATGPTQGTILSGLAPFVDQLELFDRDLDGILDVIALSDALVVVPNLLGEPLD